MKGNKIEKEMGDTILEHEKQNLKLTYQSEK